MSKTVTIIMLWVIHLSALIGIAMGNGAFFYPKSPLTLIYLAILTVWFFPVTTIKKIILFLLCFCTGMAVEWIGVHTGSLFGDYHYGINMGFKLDGIPYLIGSNWAVLTFITHELSRKYIPTPWMIPLVGAGLMVLLDFFLEQICDIAGFWHFTGGAGWFNYVCWFIIAAILHTILLRFKLKGDLKISLHLYGVQLLFAILLWIITTT